MVGTNPQSRQAAGERQPGAEPDSFQSRVGRRAFRPARLSVPARLPAAFSPLLHSAVRPATGTARRGTAVASAAWPAAQPAARSTRNPTTWSAAGAARSTDATAPGPGATAGRFLAFGG